MTFAIQLFDADGSVVLDSTASTIFLVQRGAFGAGANGTISANNGMENVAAILWPSSPDTMMTYTHPAWRNGWYRCPGPWKWHASVVSGVTTMTYPDVRWWEWQMGNHSYPWSQSVAGNAASCEYDLFGNV